MLLAGAQIAVLAGNPRQSVTLLGEGACEKTFVLF